MVNFKHIKVIKNTPRDKIIETESEDTSFKLTFVLKDGKIHTSLISQFSFKNIGFVNRVKYCFKILFNKPFELKNVFNFKNGLHVVNVSDALYIMSREIHKGE
jgi:hypothetical protein